jgi:hypothetical protein
MVNGFPCWSLPVLPASLQSPVMIQPLPELLGGVTSCLWNLRGGQPGLTQLQLQMPAALCFCACQDSHTQLRPFNQCAEALLGAR